MLGKRGRAMSQVPETRNDSLSSSRMQRLKLVCLRFAADCQSEPRPQIEDYLAEVAETERPVLLGRLLVLEFADRVHRGETVLLDEYARRFPEHAALIHAAFEEAVQTTLSRSALTDSART